LQPEHQILILASSRRYQEPVIELSRRGGAQQLLSALWSVAHQASQCRRRRLALQYYRNRHSCSGAM